MVLSCAIVRVDEWNLSGNIIVQMKKNRIRFKFVSILRLWRG